MGAVSGKDKTQWDEYINDHIIASWLNVLFQNSVENDLLQYLKLWQDWKKSSIQLYPIRHLSFWKLMPNMEWIIMTLKHTHKAETLMHKRTKRHESGCGPW